MSVIDTGVDYTNPAFGSCTAPATPSGCKVVYAQDFANDDHQLDDDGHGTNVAGIVVGVAPSTSILALDVFRPNGSATDADILAAVDFTISNQATYNVRAMNLSFGDASHHTSACSGSTYASVFASARAAGILPVVAAGNDAVSGGGFTNGISDPACAPGAVSVGAVYDGNNGGITWGTGLGSCTDATTTADQITCFPQSASILTVLAPGALITAAGITFGGTSQATPHVSGAVAVLAAKNPVATVDEITSSIAGSGPLVTDSRNGVAKHRFDLPDAATAVGDPPPIPTIASFAPTSGGAGTSVVITGTNFTGATEGAVRRRRGLLVHGGLGHADLGHGALGSRDRPDLRHEPRRHRNECDRLHVHRPASVRPVGVLRRRHQGREGPGDRDRRLRRVRLVRTDQAPAAYAQRPVADDRPEHDLLDGHVPSLPRAGEYRIVAKKITLQAGDMCVKAVSSSLRWV